MPAFTRMKPAYEELPADALKESASKSSAPSRTEPLPNLPTPRAYPQCAPIQQAIQTRVSRAALVNELLDKGFAWERQNGTPSSAIANTNRPPHAVNAIATP